MAIYEKLIVTDAGRRLLEKVYLEKKLEFTKVTTFEKINFTSPVQYIQVSSFVYDSNNKVLNITAGLTNRDLQRSYYLNCVGLYANDPDEGEILFAYINAVRADYITAFDSKIGETVLDITFSIKVSATDNFQVVIPEQAYALANDLLNKVVVINNENTIPINLGFVIDDKLNISTDSKEIKVSPAMGIKIVEE